MKYVTTVGEKQFHVEVLDEHHILLDGKPFEINFTSIGGQPVYSLLLNGRSLEAHAVPQEDGWQVLLHGIMYDVRVEDERAIHARSIPSATPADNGEFLLRAPMPGLVVAIPVEIGQTVEKGAPLVILESMKMQNELRSTKAGTVHEIKVAAGQAVEQKQVLVVVK